MKLESGSILEVRPAEWLRQVNTHEVQGTPLLIRKMLLESECNFYKELHPMQKWTLLPILARRHNNSRITLREAKLRALFAIYNGLDPPGSSKNEHEEGNWMFRCLAAIQGPTMANCISVNEWNGEAKTTRIIDIELYRKIFSMEEKELQDWFKHDGWGDQPLVTCVLCDGPLDVVADGRESCSA